MIRTVKRGILLVALVAAAYAGFRWGPAVFPRLERMMGMADADTPAAVEPSPELADETLDRFERFRRGDAGDRLALGGTELTSLVRYALPGMLPPGVDEPTVTLEDGRVHVAARVAVSEFPQLPDLNPVVGLLPDTVLIELRGGLVPHDQAHLALVVDRVRAARIPLPQRMVSDVLQGLRGERSATLPPDALAVPLPDGLASVFVQRDSLILLAESGGG